MAQLNLLKCSNLERIFEAQVLSISDWEQIRDHIESTQIGFLNKLSVQWPQLSKNDLHIIMLIRLNLSSERIAALFHIQKASLATRRYRLARKMEFNGKGLIVEYIRSL